MNSVGNFLLLLNFFFFSLTASPVLDRDALSRAPGCLTRLADNVDLLPSVIEETTETIRTRLHSLTPLFEEVLAARKHLTIPAHRELVSSFISFYAHLNAEKLSSLHHLEAADLQQDLRELDAQLLQAGRSAHSSTCLPAGLIERMTTINAHMAQLLTPEMYPRATIRERSLHVISTAGRDPVGTMVKAGAAAAVVIGAGYFLVQGKKYVFPPDLPKSHVNAHVAAVAKEIGLTVIGDAHSVSDASSTGWSDDDSDASSMTRSAGSKDTGNTGGTSSTHTTVLHVHHHHHGTPPKASSSHLSSLLRPASDFVPPAATPEVVLRSWRGKEVPFVVNTQRTDTRQAHDEMKKGELRRLALDNLPSYEEILSDGTQAAPLPTPSTWQVMKKGYDDAAKIAEGEEKKSRRKAQKQSMQAFASLYNGETRLTGIGDIQIQEAVTAYHRMVLAPVFAEAEETLTFLVSQQDNLTAAEKVDPFFSKGHSYMVELLKQAIASEKKAIKKVTTKPTNVSIEDLHLPWLRLRDAIDASTKQQRVETESRDRRGKKVKSVALIDPLVISTKSKQWQAVHEATGADLRLYNERSAAFMNTCLAANSVLIKKAQEVMEALCGRMDAEVAASGLTGDATEADRMHDGFSRTLQAVHAKEGGGDTPSDRVCALQEALTTIMEAKAGEQTEEIWSAANALCRVMTTQFIAE